MDIIEDFLERLAQHVPPETGHAIAAQLRATWGGTTPYVRKTPRDKTSLIAAGLRQRLTMTDVFKVAGVSRRHGYRLLGRK